MQKTDFMCLSFYAKQVMLEASMNRITSLELTKNTNAVFSATKQMKRLHGHGCWKLLSQWEKSAIMQSLRVKLKYMKDVSFSWN